MRRKRDTAQRRDDISWRRGRTGEGRDDVSWADMNFTGPKMKKIHAVNLAAINIR
jgi:hypothetical protein